MTANDDLRPDAWGLHHTWVDAHGRVQQVDPDHLATLQAVAGTPPADLEETAPLVLRRGDRLPRGGQVECEDGSVLDVGDVLPADAPLGYHRLRTSDGRSRPLIVSPGRCWLPDGWRAWGWTVQLYAARSSSSWGMGDLADLRRLREWSERLGAGFLLVNPLHAVAPTFPQEASPYLPTTRRFRNPIYLAVGEVSGAEAVDLAPYVERGRALNAQPLIDRDAVWALKREALRAVFEVWRRTGRGPGSAFDRWIADQGSGLRDFAIWMVLAATHGADWREWPAALRDPSASAVAEVPAARADDVEFEGWLQWQLSQQLQAASGDFTVIQDLPIGVDGGGADAWVWQSVLAYGVTVGAPPDVFNNQGQKWGSPPMVPWRTRAADYRPFVESVRASMADSGGLRIDHVMGLFRLWWVPPDGHPTHGAYVRYPSDDLLDIVALESHRHRALVVGEDLGTVEEGVRESLAERAILSYRLLWFEQSPPSTWPVSAMAAISTHDLPTVAGLWDGTDLADQERHTGTDSGVLRDQRDALLAPLLAGLESERVDPRMIGVEEAVAAAHELLAQAPSVLLSATLDDACAARLRPNMPGTPDRDNWCLPLPRLIDDLMGDSDGNNLAYILKRAVSTPTRRSNGPDVPPK